MVRAPFGMLVSEAPEPLKVVAVSVPLEELKARFVPVLGERIPEAAVVNTGKQVVSEDSSSTVMNVDAVARVAVDALPLKSAVIVPALKLPEPSLATIAEVVFAEVALEVTVKVAAPDPL